ncbi:unnamed protein product [Arabis nemorensis]|uniref:Uncharacterized protein n=1 Tax=Arabis nemorensis TaxID=586526 RepID=A0A565CHF5_9BRAS|nr:unnamed protein product [Arabis nemorensis]
MATREMQREMATRDKLFKLARPKFDGFADRQSSHESFWGDPAMAVEICSDRRPCRALVTLYAEIGLHRYNLLHRTNFKFLRVEKYNYFIPLPITTYFITFLAIDPAASSHPQTFQTKVGEYVKTTFALSVYIARRLGDDLEEQTYQLALPKWPPENQFYMPDASELQRYDLQLL